MGVNLQMLFITLIRNTYIKQKWLPGRTAT